MLLADVLAPNRRQAISNHHADSTIYELRLSAYESYQQCRYHVTTNKQTNGLVQNCSISIANALEILQSCTKPSKECSTDVRRSATLCYCWVGLLITIILHGFSAIGYKCSVSRQISQQAPRGTFHGWFCTHISNVMEIWFWWNLLPGHQTITNVVIPLNGLWWKNC